MSVQGSSVGSEASVQEDSRGPGCPRWPPEEEPGTPSGVRWNPGDAPRCVDDPVSRKPAQPPAWAGAGGAGGAGRRRPVSCRDARPLLFCPLSQDELQLISSHQLNSHLRAGSSSSSDDRWRVRAPPGLWTEGASIRVERV